MDPLFRVLYVTLNTLKEKGAFFLTLRIRWETTEPNDMDDADENDDETSKRRRKEGMVLDAIRNRVSFIQEKKTELGEKGFRRILEKDLKLEKRALDDVIPHQTFIPTRAGIYHDHGTHAPTRSGPCEAAEQLQSPSEALASP